MRRWIATLVLAALLSPSLIGQGNSAWIAWARDHHHAIASLTSSPDDDFADLGFLKSALGDRRLVQLGESGHGVKEFNQVKVRLIKYLHEQMGFDVIAFESAVYECFAANEQEGTAEQLLRSSIFTVWATEEVRELFEYVKSTRATDRPLILAGFDSQNSSSIGNRSRPTFFRRVIASIDADHAERVARTDGEMLDLVSRGPSMVRASEARMIEFYEGLAAYLEGHLGSLEEALPGDPSPKIAYRSAWSMAQFVRQLVAMADRPNDFGPEGGSAKRDQAMAENLTYLARQIYPHKKILVWAHNYHIRHNNGAGSSGVQTMGYWIRERFRDELYTIGLFMNRGTAAQNNRTIYAIDAAPANSMEWVMANVGPSALFMDFLNQTRGDGNSWMFETMPHREWGTGILRLIPRDQYDGVIYIDLVSPPTYL